MAGRWCLHQKYLLPFPWKMFAAIQTISLAGGGGGNCGFHILECVRFHSLQAGFSDRWDKGRKRERERS